jgi:hypothetical protein
MTEILTREIQGADPLTAPIVVPASEETPIYWAAREPRRQYLSAIRPEGPCDGGHGRFCPECAAVNRWQRDPNPMFPDLGKCGHRNRINGYRCTSEVGHREFHRDLDGHRWVF